MRSTRTPGRLANGVPTFWSSASETHEEIVNRNDGCLGALIPQGGGSAPPCHLVILLKPLASPVLAIDMVTGSTQTNETGCNTVRRLSISTTNPHRCNRRLSAGAVGRMQRTETRSFDHLSFSNLSETLMKSRMLMFGLLISGLMSGTASAQIVDFGDDFQAYSLGLGPFVPIGNGWEFFNTNGSFPGYGGAANADGPQISAITGDGAGNQYLNVFADYNNPLQPTESFDPQRIPESNILGSRGSLRRNSVLRFRLCQSRSRRSGRAHNHRSLHPGL